MYDLNNIEKLKLKKFFNACDEMIDGKFILSDIKISAILNSIASCELLYNLFAKSLINFNFSTTLKKCIRNEQVNGGRLQLPDDEKEILALVFCLLLETDNQKINLQNFVNEYFYNPNGYNISYGNFSHNVLIPFKQCVLNQLGVNTSGELIDAQNNMMKENQVGMEEIINENINAQNGEKIKILYANLVVSLNELYSAVLRDTHIKLDQKDEIYIIVKALNEAIKLENISIINALVIPLEYVLGKNRNVKNYYNTVKDNLISIYEAYA